MKNETSDPATLSDSDLLMDVRRLVSREREATAALIAALGEIDARRLYLAEGCSSLFTYCTQVLHLSEHAAYGRIEAARAARKWPVVLALLVDGSLHLTAVSLLSRHLTADNHPELLAAARHKTKRDVEEIVAALRPLPPVASTIRRLPVQAARSRAVDILATGEGDALIAPAVVPRVELSEHPPARRSPAEIKPLAPERYKVQFTASRDTYDKLREAQDLLRHRIPEGDVGAIVDRALTLLLAELHRAKHGAVNRPRPAPQRAPQGRHIPAAVKRAVWDRDGGRCALIGAAGRCSERGFLEYHHVIPFADRGAAVVDNLELRCRAHNAYEAERWFGLGGEDVMRERAVSYEVVCDWQTSTCSNGESCVTTSQVEGQTHDAMSPRPGGGQLRAGVR
ncbi:MAG: HNH endonuclease [Acidobacteria bacterium]|nr:HNH endonuclease [Acidobacteriota bacterium]